MTGEKREQIERILHEAQSSYWFINAVFKCLASSTMCSCMVLKQRKACEHDRKLLSLFTTIPEKSNSQQIKVNLISIFFFLRLLTLCPPLLSPSSYALHSPSLVKTGQRQTVKTRLTERRKLHKKIAANALLFCSLIS